MIRSSRHSLKFANKQKKNELEWLIFEYRKLACSILNVLWPRLYDENKIPTFLDSEQLKTFETPLSSRMKQACSKQVLAVIKGTLSKRRKQKFVFSKNTANKKLQSKIDREIGKPDLSNINLELDSRFIDFEETETFMFVRISSVGQKKQIKIPIKMTSVSNRWKQIGETKQSVRLSLNKLHLLYEIPEIKTNGTKILAADQGIVNTIILSDGQETKRCVHGHNLQTIQKKMCLKKKGSKAFQRAQDHRLNYINWSIKQLNFDNCKELRLEKVKKLRFKKRTNRYMNHWSYTLIKRKLVELSESKGFAIKEVSNCFRSQRCNNCGFVRKANRNGKTFSCKNCGYTNDADKNAAFNLLLDLFEIPNWVRLNKLNRQGFFWTSDGLFDLRQEPIVPVTQKSQIS